MPRVTEVRCLERRDGWRPVCVASAGADRIASLWSDGVVRLWPNLGSRHGAVILETENAARDRADTMSFSQQGSRLAIGGRHYASLWNTKTRTEFASLRLPRWTENRDV